jgi:SRSO17 transposase
MGTHLKDAPDHQSIRHMLSNSPWSYEEVLDELSNVCIELLRKTRQPIYLLLDEVGFRKKGLYSACVGNQYLGCIGKNDNGQVAVVVAICSGELYVPIDLRLFMPENWEDDWERREKAHIPDHIKHESKVHMGLQMIQRVVARFQGLDFAIFDALYGSSTTLLGSLIEDKIPFIGEVRENQTFYLQKPEWVIPEAKSSRGRKPTIPKPNKEDFQVKNYFNSLNKKTDFKMVKIRQGTKGMIKARCHRKKVWVLNEQTNQFMELYLLIRINKRKIKYALGYSPKPCAMKTMIRAQAQRVFVERVFEEGKNIVGMGDYQVRSWTGFHKHMTLVALALLYIAVHKLRLKRKNKTISAYIIQEIINSIIQLNDIMDQIIMDDNPPEYPTMAKIRKKG